MIKLIKMYFKMKMNEWKLKAQVYGAIGTFIDNQEDVVDVVKKLYNSLKSADENEVQEIFTSKLVELVHEQMQKKLEEESKE